MKGEVGRQYTSETTLSDVLQRFNKSFGGFSSDVVHGCINKCNDLLYKLNDEMKLMDDDMFGDDSDGSDGTFSISSESDSSSEESVFYDTE